MPMTDATKATDAPSGRQSHAAGSAPQRRASVKRADLRGALALLVQAQAIASGKTEPAGPLEVVRHAHERDIRGEAEAQAA